MSNFTNTVALTAATTATLGPTTVVGGPAIGRFAITQAQLAIIRNPVLFEQALAISTAVAIPGPPDLSEPISVIVFFATTDPREIVQTIIGNLFAVHDLIQNRLANLLFATDQQLKGCPVR